MKRLLCVISAILLLFCSCANSTITELSHEESEADVQMSANKEQAKLIFVGYKNTFFSNAMYSGLKSVYDGEIICLDIMDDKDFATLNERIIEVTSQNNVSAIVYSTGAVIYEVPQTDIPVVLLAINGEDFSLYADIVDILVITPSYEQYNESAAQIIKQQDCNVVGTVYGAGGPDSKYIYKWEHLKNQLGELEYAEPAGNALRNKGLAEKYISDTDCDCLYLLDHPEASLEYVNEDMYVIAAATFWEDCFNALISGSIDCIINPDFYNIGRLTGETINDLIEGETVDPKIFTEPVVLQTAQDAKDYVEKSKAGLPAAS